MQTVTRSTNTSTSTMRNFARCVRVACPPTSRQSTFEWLADTDLQHPRLCRRRLGPHDQCPGRPHVQRRGHHHLGRYQQRRVSITCEAFPTHTTARLHAYTRIPTPTPPKSCDRAVPTLPRVLVTLCHSSRFHFLPFDLHALLVLTPSQHVQLVLDERGVPQHLRHRQQC